MALSQLNFTGLNKIENLTVIAIKRLQEYEPLTKGMGYYFADGYGKDSSVVSLLLDMAKVKHDAHYHKGGIDPPELVYFGRENHPDTVIDRPKMSVWKGIEKKGMPSRVRRWCCEMIKEWGGAGRVVVTGIRWKESSRRASRRMFEVCRKDKTKYFLHPIIDWTSNDVWDFIHINNLPYCSLYDEGFKRLGCVLCPMETARQTQIELKRWPKIAEAWYQACIRYWERHTEGTARWATAEDMWQWWLSRKGEPKVNDAQCIMFDN
jgi:phosphoadenosine phosphosulfate reductase